MRIIKKELKNGKVTVAIENADDLWHLSQIIEKGDLILSKTTRKIKLGEKEEASKKTMLLEIRTETTEFGNNTLRISGTTNQEKEEIPKGSHHTITLEEGSVATVTKHEWPKYQLNRLEQATTRQPRTVMVAIDREEAAFALLRSQGYETLSQIKGKVAKKGAESTTENFYKEVAEKLAEYAKRYESETIIIASPAFWKDELMKEIKDAALRKKTVLATCSTVGTNSFEEVLKRPELKEVLRRQRASQESQLVEELMKEIGKDGLAAYGKKETGEAISTGNARTLLITSSYTEKNRKEAELLMKNAEAVSSEVFIINSENEAGKKLDALGGIAVIMRYAVH